MLPLARLLTLRDVVTIIGSVFLWTRLAVREFLTHPQSVFLSSSFCGMAALAQAVEKNLKMSDNALEVRSQLFVFL